MAFLKLELEYWWVYGKNILINQYLKLSSWLEMERVLPDFYNYLEFECSLKLYKITVDCTGTFVSSYIEITWKTVIFTETSRSFVTSFEKNEFNFQLLMVSLIT